MKIEELCERRQELLRILSWVELLIIRARFQMTIDSEAESRKQALDDLNKAAEYFPRVLRGDTIVVKRPPKR